MSAFPIGDWQFWVATGIALIALWFTIRPMMPRRGKSPACPSCPTTAGEKPTRPTLAKLTMDGTEIPMIQKVPMIQKRDHDPAKSPSKSPAKN